MPHAPKPHPLFCTLLLTAALPVMAAAQSATLAGAPAANHAAFVAPVGANVVDVVTKEYAFQMPDSIPAGLTTLHLRDDGQQAHHIMLVRLEHGKTMRDFADAMQAQGPLPSWIHWAGGPNTPLPGGGEAYATVTLEPGSYLAFCVIPGPDGAPHFMKGMMKQFTVTPSSRKAPVPASDVTIEVKDYAFGFSKPLTAGRHTIQVHNAGPQVHEIVFMKIPPGATIDQMVAWGEKPNGPPPLIPWGGITSVAAGATMYMHVDLVPGDYALICFVPDAKDGKPHAAHGMTQRITVQ